MSPLTVITTVELGEPEIRPKKGACKQGSKPILVVTKSPEPPGTLDCC